MGWIIATTLDKKHANLQSNLIAAILDRVAGAPQSHFQNGFGSLMMYMKMSIRG